MLDLNHLPKTGNGNIDYFYNTGGTSSWVTWEKPRGIHTIVLTCIGAGGGGRSGWGSNSSNASGGGGGGSGGFTRLLIPAMVLPDVLYVQVGRGGAGGAAVLNTANAGANGTASYVSIAPSIAAIYVACYANGGSGAAVGSIGSCPGGAAAVIATQANALISGLGQFFALVGQAGATGGGNGVSGSSITYPTTGLLLSGGAGAGGGTIFDGGNVTAPTQSLFSLITTRIGGSLSANLSRAGADGISLLQPLMSIGGAGGSGFTASSSSPSTRGGNGGLGSGGGGGGGGDPSLNIGSAGGNGGDGLVIIQTF